MLHPVEGGFGDVEIAVVDESLHPAVEEGEQQGPDVGTVHVRVGHDDDPVIPERGQVEFRVDPGAQRGDQRLDLLVLQHPVRFGLLDVQDLAA